MTCRFISRCAVPDYSKDPVAMLDVLAELHRHNCVVKTISTQHGAFAAILQFNKFQGEDIEGESLPHAACLAALAWAEQRNATP